MVSSCHYCIPTFERPPTPHFWLELQYDHVTSKIAECVQINTEISRQQGRIVKECFILEKKLYLHQI